MSLTETIKVSSHSRKFEFKVFRIILVMTITFDVLDRFHENEVWQTTLNDNE